MKLAYSSSFIEITVRVNTCSFSSRVSHSLMLATLNYQVGVLFCSAVTLCFLKLNTWLAIFLFFFYLEQLIMKGALFVLPTYHLWKKEMFQVCWELLHCKVLCGFHGHRCGWEKVWQDEICNIFFIETQRWVSHPVFWCHWLVKLALAERDSENARVSFLVFMCVHAKWGWGGIVPGSNIRLSIK